MFRHLVLLCFVVLSGCAGSTTKSPDPASWTWEVVRSGVPNFEGKNNDELVVVGIRFQNKLPADQILTVSQPHFTVNATDGEPIQVVGLLFQKSTGSGAKRMSATGGGNDTELLIDVRGTTRYPFIHTRGPVEIVVGGQRSYVQGLILARPHEQTKARLRFGALPEIEFELPDVAPTE